MSADHVSWYLDLSRNLAMYQADDAKELVARLTGTLLWLWDQCSEDERALIERKLQADFGMYS